MISKWHCVSNYALVSFPKRKQVVFVLSWVLMSYKSIRVNGYDYYRVCQKIPILKLSLKTKHRSINQVMKPFLGRLIHYEPQWALWPQVDDRSPMVLHHSPGYHKLAVWKWQPVSLKSFHV